MTGLTCFFDSNDCVIWDTSTVINVAASGYAVEIARALPNRVLVAESVSIELEEGRLRGHSHAAVMDQLVSARLIEIVPLGNMGEECFEGLVMGTDAETLDDGEAATIAYAIEHGTIALIDERKATRLCEKRFPDLRLGCTMDIFAHPAVLRALGEKKQAEAVLNALRYARMRVLPHYIDWVVERIGVDQAATCRSLSRLVRVSPPNSPR